MQWLIAMLALYAGYPQINMQLSLGSSMVISIWMEWDKISLFYLVEEIVLSAEDVHLHEIATSI